MVKATEAYRKAGVDIEGADNWIHRMQRLIRTTPQAGVLDDGGRFAGLFALGSRFGKDTVLVASTDGVGTKLKLAQLTGIHTPIGVDVVAMNTNDVLVHGAQPIFFLDYIAVGALRPAVMTALMRGVVEGCRQSGCALLGGETAEMPGVYAPDEYDIVGFCVGAVANSKRVTGERVKAGDAVIGMASTGVHANGFSLVRKVFNQKELMENKRSLLQPTRIYVQPVLDVMKAVPIHALAHITGGGLARRVPSLVQRTSGLAACLERGAWKVPSIFKRIQAAGGLSEAAMAATFNMGIGMALVCPKAAVAKVIQIIERHAMPAWQIGVIEKIAG
jgi:phosphoribosylformylglycinamidine cyclo-ligase